MGARITEEGAWGSFALHAFKSFAFAIAAQVSATTHTRAPWDLSMQLSSFSVI